MKTSTIILRNVLMFIMFLSINNLNGQDLKTVKCNLEGTKLIYSKQLVNLSQNNDEYNAEITTSGKNFYAIYFNNGELGVFNKNGQTSYIKSIGYRNGKKNISTIDMNKDNKEDIILLNSHCLQILYGGVETFTIIMGPTQDLYNSSFTLNDFDNNGLVDIALITYNNDIKIHIFYQNINNGFDRVTHDFVDHSFPIISSGDVNNDKKNDIIIHNEKGIYVLLNKKNNFFTKDNYFIKTDIPSYTKDIEVADVNNDGKDDIIVGKGSNFHSNNARIFTFIQKKKNIVAKDTIIIDGSYSSIRVTDINNDKKNELIIIGHKGIKIIKDKSNISEWFGQGVQWPSSDCITINDLNNNGKADILHTGYYKKPVIYYQK